MKIFVRWYQTDEVLRRTRTTMDKLPQATEEPVQTQESIRKRIAEAIAIVNGCTIFNEDLTVV